MACRNGRCISEQKKCDGHDDCEDGTDEAMCARCKLTQPQRFFYFLFYKKKNQKSIREVRERLGVSSHELRGANRGHSGTLKHCLKTNELRLGTVQHDTLDMFNVLSE